MIPWSSHPSINHGLGYTGILFQAWGAHRLSKRGANNVTQERGLPSIHIMFDGLDFLCSLGACRRAVSETFGISLLGSSLVGVGSVCINSLHI